MNWYLLAAIPVFGLLVLVHEFGHFITAKWAGIRVEEFGLGFPPRIVGFRKRSTGGWQLIWLGGGQDAEDEVTGQNNPFAGTSGGVSADRPASEHTIYSLNLLPIGGFVRMPGENGDINDAEGKYDPGSFAAKPAGKRIIVLVAGVVMNFLLAMLLFTIAYGLGEPVIPPQIGQVVAGTPAQAAGLRVNDTILAVNGQPVSSFSDVGTDIAQITGAYKGNASTVPVTLLVRHSGETAPVSVPVNVRLHPPAGQGAMGIVATDKIFYQKIPLWQAPFKGIAYTFDVTRQFLVGIGQMIVGAIRPQVAGPVGIVKITGQVAQSVPTVGWWPILNLTAVLSINLAIINILPFPALDGGRILLIGIELLRGGKRLKPEREGIINFIGMAVLLTLMIVVTFSDVLHWGS
jgi:regulator of sigma E protease